MGRNTSMAVLVSVFVIMIGTFVYEGDLSNITGNVITGDNTRDVSNVYDFLVFVDSHPENFQIVVGKYAKPYEIKYAKAIADHFGIVFNEEKGVTTKDNMILYGNPDSNSLLDKLYTHTYDKSDSALQVDRGNLMIVVSGELQAQRVNDLIFDFRNKREKLLLSEARFNLGDILGVAVMVTVAIVSLFLLIVDISRKKAIKKDKYKHTMEDLEDYIIRYSKEGRNVYEIRQWLTTHGYESDMVDKAIANVRTNIPNKTN